MKYFVQNWFYQMNMLLMKIMTVKMYCKVCACSGNCTWQILQLQIVLLLVNLPNLSKINNYFCQIGSFEKSLFLVRTIPLKK